MTEKPVHPFRSTHEFKGLSMWPTLQPGDGLVVEPYSAPETIRVGDIVMFVDPIHARNIVHRVISMRQGIVTQGDNNRDHDLQKLQPVDITGKIIWVFRKNRSFRVWNGVAGNICGWFCRIRRRLLFYGRQRGKPFYRKLIDMGGIRLPDEWLQLQVVRFRRQRHTEVILRMRRRWTIGVFRPERQRWEIRRPLRLLIDEQFLADSIKEFDKTIINNQQCESQVTLYRRMGRFPKR